MQISSRPQRPLLTEGREAHVVHTWKASAGLIGLIRYPIQIQIAVRHSTHMARMSSLSHLSAAFRTSSQTECPPPTHHPHPPTRSHLPRDVASPSGYM